jgi:Spy/CpxP family protein refolding chaperone
MKGLLLALAMAATLAFTAFTFGYAAGPASAHRSWCHSKHTCPSDHATYRWGPKRLLCVKPTSEKRNASFRTRVRYGGLTYWCKR